MIVNASTEKGLTNYINAKNPKPKSTSIHCTKYQQAQRDKRDKSASFIGHDLYNTSIWFYKTTFTRLCTTYHKGSLWIH